MRSDPLARVVGHEEGRALLRIMLERQRVPNGILITGPEGCGRRLLAKAFAEALLFGDAAGLVADDDRAARRMRAGAHPDVCMLEREEGKRQLSIDAVRELRAEFGMKPLEAARRVAVVVDAERLTEEAGNALLKLLEEPPAGSHLILTARSPGALMETLLSRCVRVRLGPVEEGTLLAWLGQQGFSGPAAELAVMASEGAPGRALDLVRAGFAEQLPTALSLLSARQSPFLLAQALQPHIEEDKKSLEASRERLRTLLKTALFLLHWRRRELENFALPAGLPELGAVANDATDAAERSAQILQALQVVDSNVAPVAVLHHAAMGGLLNVGAVRAV